MFDLALKDKDFRR